MKKITLTLIVITLFMIPGCKDKTSKTLYFPESKNDKVYTAIGGGYEKDEKNKTEFCFIAENVIIELNSDISNIHMEPISVESDFGDGFKWTNNKYENVEIKTLLSDDNKNMINKISTKSSDYKTTRGIKVGDNTAKLKHLYKEYLTYSESDERKYYMYDPEDDIGFKRIYFYVEKDIIEKIIIEDGIDG